MATKKEITKEEKILKEQRRLKRIFADLEEGKKKLVTPLIEKAAFMSIELDELQETIEKDGWISEYQNGANQHGTKRSPEADTYIALSKSPKRSGAYAKGWRKKQIYETRAKKQNTVYNAKKHQLTHLLEKGHRRKNTDRAGVTHTSRTPTTAPRVHIAPVEQQMIKDLEEKIKKVAKG